MSLSPFFKSPFTDFSGAVLSYQWNGGRCSKLEMKALDCLEAYGLDSGLRKCEDLIHDFQECALGKKEMKRLIDMRTERERQFAAGERTREDRYATPPKPDSY